MRLKLDLKFERQRSSIWFMFCFIALYFMVLEDGFSDQEFWGILISISFLILGFLSRSYRDLNRQNTNSFELSWGPSILLRFSEFSFSKTDIVELRLEQNTRNYYQIKVLLDNGDVYTLFTHPNKKPTLEKLEEIKAFINYQN